MGWPPAKIERGGKQSIGASLRNDLVKKIEKAKGASRRIHIKIRLEKGIEVTKKPLSGEKRLF
ncbi:MAG: hypothetical protein JNK89_00290 [Saprospiraceae bacterium]|nr:hypothetical protein [Saprospiraceae bacterium]